MLRNRLTFLYQLEMNGVPFYVGVSCDPVSRYMAHYNTNCVDMKDYLFGNLRKRIVADMKILEVLSCNSRTAQKTESRKIAEFLSKGIILMNAEHHRFRREYKYYFKNGVPYKLILKAYDRIQHKRNDIYIQIASVITTQLGNIVKN